MHAMFFAPALTTSTARINTPTQDPAVMHVVNQFIDAFNKGDTKTAGVLCSDIRSIVDELPPYE